MDGSAFDYFYDVPVEKITLNFNKPYMFIIRDKSTGEVWFVGTVYKPLSLNDEPETNNQFADIIISYSEYYINEINYNYSSYGDVNCDGEINISDSIYLENYLAGKNGYNLTEQEKKKADVNQDGKVDKTDLNIIKNNTAGTEVVDTNEIAETLFEEAMIMTRDSYKNYAGNGDTEKIGNNYYIETKASYEQIKEEYAKVFTGEALEEALNLDFYNSNGATYILARAGGTPWELVELNVEKVNQSNDELAYKAMYKLRYSDDPAGKQPTQKECEFKIKQMDGKYRIFETNFWE